MKRMIGRLAAGAFLALAGLVLQAPEAGAHPNFFTARGCVGCHTAAAGEPAIKATCSGCHKHGGSVKGVTDKSVYAPGETVSVTVTGGGKGGWVRALLLDQDGTEVARTAGNQSGKGSSAILPVVLSAPAPTTPGTYTWKAAWFGNYNNGGSTHGAIATPMKPFTVAVPGEAPQGAQLSVSALPDGSVTSQRVLNVAGTVTGGDGTARVTINRKPVKLLPDGSFSRALKLRRGVNSISVAIADKTGTVTTDLRTITYDPTAPVVTIAVPADNARTAASFVEVAGSVNEAASVSVALNGGSPSAAVVSGTSFTAPVYLNPGANVITVVATDAAGNSSTSKRTITYDNVSPSLAVTVPEQDLPVATPSLLLKGTVSDEGSVSVTVSMGDKSFSPPVKAGAFQQRLTFPAEGTYEITVTARDAAGNLSTVVRTVVFNDQI